MSAHRPGRSILGIGFSVLRLLASRRVRPRDLRPQPADAAARRPAARGPADDRINPGRDLRRHANPGRRLGRHRGPTSRCRLTSRSSRCGLTNRPHRPHRRDRGGLTRPLGLAAPAARRRRHVRIRWPGRPTYRPARVANHPALDGHVLARLLWTGSSRPIRYFLALWLDLEHAGNLSRQAPGRRRPFLAVPRHAGAIRTRSAARCAAIQRFPHPGALPFLVPGQRLRRGPAARPAQKRARERRGARRFPPVRAVPAPVASPSGVTTAREPTYGGALPRCRRVGRQVSCAEQPFEVSHIRRPGHARRAGPTPWSARPPERRAAVSPCWSGALRPRAPRRETPALPGPPPLAGHRAGQPSSVRPLGAAPPAPAPGP